AASVSVYVTGPGDGPVKFEAAPVRLGTVAPVWLVQVGWRTTAPSPASRTPLPAGGLTTNAVGAIEAGTAQSKCTGVTRIAQAFNLPVSPPTMSAASALQAPLVLNPSKRPRFPIGSPGTPK